MGVFILVFTLGFLDRQLLAAVAPTLKGEFHLSNTQYGELLSAFYLVYAVAAPAAGLFVDRVGLNAGASIAVLVWSLAGAATGLSQTFRGLLACCIGLGLGESASIPMGAKAAAMYLEPAELGLAGGFGAASISLGSIAAPLVAAVTVPRYGWRSVFILCGLLGLLWVQLWLFTSRRIPPRAEARAAPRTPARELLRDRRLWAVVLAYSLVFTLYMLWTNWTTVYLVQERGLTELEANRRFAWFPPAFAILGGFLGGALAFRWIRGGMEALAARMRACWFSTPLLLACAAIPFAPSTTQAAVAIGVSFLSFQSILNNIAVMPIDLFGAGPAGFSNSMLACAAAGTQAVISPVIGAVVDRFGFAAVCVAAALLPLPGLGLLHLSVGRGARATAA